MNRRMIQEAVVVRERVMTASVQLLETAQVGVTVSTANPSLSHRGSEDEAGE